MSIVTEISDLSDVLAKLVKNTQTLVKAVNDGRKYLASRYPDAASDVAALLDEMHATIEGLAEITAVTQDFRFTIDSGAGATDSLERFNQHVLLHRKQFTALRRRIGKLKGSCSKIGDLREKLKRRADDSTWDGFLKIVGLTNPKTRSQIAGTISEFYADDQRLIFEIERALKLSRNALSDVNRLLGPPGMQFVENVPAAARALGHYADMFEGVDTSLQSLADSLASTAGKLKA